MKDITIPLPDILDQELAEVEVTVAGKKQKYNFRLENFDWGLTDDNGKLLYNSLKDRVKELKRKIEDYNSEWELVQIFRPKPGAESIQVLFRHKSEPET